MSETTIRAMPGTTPRNGLPFKPYAYSGGDTDTLTPPELQAQLDEQFGPDEPEWPHGTRWQYRRGCRCRGCRDAESVRRSRYRRYRQLSKCGACGYSVTSLNHKTLCWRAS